MEKTHLAVTALRIMLVVAFALLLLFQTMSMPGQFAQMTEENPDEAYLRWPLTVVMRALLRQATMLRSDMDAVL